MKKTTKVYLITEEELERFDLMMTALGQAFWAMSQQRSIKVPNIIDQNMTDEEQKFYQLHFNFNDQLESDPQT